MPYYQKHIEPLLTQYCFDCHADGSAKGDISFDEAGSIKHLLADRDFWQLIAFNLGTRTMPPAKKPQPSEDELALIQNWIAEKIFLVDCEKPDPGRVTLRRLNRIEYQNTIRDLLQVDFKAGDAFPPDDTGYGYDNIGDVLSVSPLLLEKYFQAAETVMEEAIRTGPPPKPVQNVKADRLSVEGGGSRRGDRIGLHSVGDAVAKISIKSSGDYTLKARVDAEQAGPETARLAFKVDGRELKQFEVKTRTGQPIWISHKTRLEKGQRKIAVRFVNDYYNPRAKQREDRDRNLYVYEIAIEGPPQALKTEPPWAHRRYLVQVPKNPKADNEVHSAARINLQRFASRAFRRPVTPAEVERWLPFVQNVMKEGGSFEEGMQLAMQAVLVSPFFLFRGEAQPDPDNPNQTHPLNEYNLASRLSYFLWSSMPDDALFEHCINGSLRSHLKAEVLRMLADPRAEALEKNFAGQWLQLRNLDLVTPERNVFPEFNSALRADMREESERLFRHIRAQNRNVLELLTADYTFINERLARHYGLDGVSGNEFRRVKLDGRRRGLLTQASILTITSLPTRTSPVNRGKWVLENILGAPIPPAPEEVPALDDSKAAAENASLRQRLQKHRESPMCKSCHERLDPIGFALENFDGTGKWRDKDHRFDIDPSGKLAGGLTFRNHMELLKLLSVEKRDSFRRSLVENLLTYALGRGLEFADRCAVEKILSRAEADGNVFSSYILGVVESAPFQMRRGDGDRF